MEQTTKLNLYQKIQKIRVELQEMNLKKTDKMILHTSNIMN